MSLDLAVLEPGSFLGRSGQCLELRKGDETLDRIPLHRLRSVTLGQGVSLSADLITALADQGTSLLIQDRAARPAAALLAPGLGVAAATRRAQARSGENGRGHHVALQLVHAKLLHQARLLATWRGYRTNLGAQGDLDALGEALKALTGEVQAQPDRAALMALEAQGAKLFWHGLRLMVPFGGRTYPRATDLTNPLLNYGYAVLTRTWFALTLQAGLDPGLGVLHGDRIGRPGLVLDLLEPWRPWVDRAVVGLLRQRVHLESQEGMLSLATRRRLIEALHRAFSVTPARHSHTLRSLWLSNTRQLAAHFLSDRPWRPLLLFP